MMVLWVGIETEVGKVVASGVLWQLQLLLRIPLGGFASPVEACLGADDWLGKGGDGSTGGDA